MLDMSSPAGIPIKSFGRRSEKAARLFLATIRTAIVRCEGRSASSTFSGAAVTVAPVLEPGTVVLLGAIFGTVAAIRRLRGKPVRSA